MKNIFKGLKSPEIIRNIIRETLMGNAVLVIEFYNQNDWHNQQASHA